MKRRYLFILLISCTLSMSTGNLQAQIIPGIGSITGLINRAIKAIDLKIQRLQNRTIKLQNVQKAIENTMTKLHLRDIGGWAQRQKDLYARYFQQLGRLKTVLSTYWKVKEIMKRQVQLVSEYNKAWNRLKKDPHFTAAELNQINRIYSGILTQSLQSLDQLTIACSVITTKMSDGKRMQLITKAGASIEQYLADLRRFNARNARFSLARAIDLADFVITRKIYGVK